MYDIPYLKKLLNVNVYKLLINNSFIFSLIDLPLILNIGKHSFLLKVDQSKILMNSLIKLLILDSNGTPLYTLIPLFELGGLRRVSFVVNNLNINGKCKIILVCVLDMLNIPLNYRLQYNYRYIKLVLIIKLYNNMSSVRFYKTPYILYTLHHIPIVNYITSYNGLIWNNILNTYSNANINISDYILDKLLTGSYISILGDNILSSSNTLLQLSLNQPCSVYNNDTFLQEFKITLIIKNNIALFEHLNYLNYVVDNFDTNNYYLIKYKQKLPLSNLSILTSDNGNIYYRAYLNIVLNQLSSYSGKLLKAKTYFKLSELGLKNYRLLSLTLIYPKNLLVHYTLPDILLNIGIIQSSTALRWFSYVSSSILIIDNTTSLRLSIISSGKLLDYLQQQLQ